MKVLSSIKAAHNDLPTVTTMGMFDGVHRGHQKIITQLKDIAAEKHLKTCLFTFWPHPRMVLQETCDLRLLTTPEEKKALLEKTGLDMLYIQKFDPAFASIDSEKFVKNFLIEKLNTSTLVIGHDHHFGKNREGDFESLLALSTKYNFKVIQQQAVDEGEKPISSTRIRKALAQGDLEYANKALGYYYLITGIVVHGDKIGRTMGYPTVNLKVDPLKLLPKDGVYGVRLKINGNCHYGLLNIGNRPTFAGNEKRVEVYILDFQSNLYEKEIQVELLMRIRDEFKFAGKEALSTQIAKDEQQFRRFLAT